MDNLCHTLVGAAIGYAGLRRTTRLANATLMIAANLPDLDVLVLATDTPSVAFRRGWTHGVLAQLALPLALTALMVVIGRRRRARPGDPPLSAGWLLLLSYIGLYSHIFLDFLNNYGIRLLTPFDWRWFYGDTLFIMDPWLWLTLGLGVWLSRRLKSTTPARVALTVAAVYIGGMLVSARIAREIVLEAWSRAWHAVRAPDHRRCWRALRDGRVHVAAAAARGVPGRPRTQERSPRRGDRGTAGARVPGVPRLVPVSVLSARERARRHARLGWRHAIYPDEPGSQCPGAWKVHREHHRAQRRGLR
jgi:membrane-bound metal-dependent hydrolase YbcI (DUF457 family)